MVKRNYGKILDRTFDVIVIIIMIIVSLIIILPLLHILACSFSNAEAVYTGSVEFLPVGLTFENYIKVFNEPSIGIGYLNTIFYTFIGTVIGLILQLSAGYAFSRRDMRFRGFLTWVYVLTMFVSGGFIPTYLVIKNLNMLNTIWAMIIPGCMSVYNIIIIRTFMSSTVAWELQEAAMLDGCGDIRMFFRIVLPLSAPVIGVMALYGIVGYWNSYFNALVYVTNSDLHPLQMIMKKILVNNDMNSIGTGSLGEEEQALLAEALKYTTIVVSSLPILIVYPFFQKFFQKGVMVGGLKG